MTQPVSYVELNSPDLASSARFFAAAFGWDPQPFAAPDYLVAPAAGGRGIDAGLMGSRDGQPRTVPIINVPSLDDAGRRVQESGGNTAGGAVIHPRAWPRRDS